MNTERLLELADIIERTPHQRDLRYWHDGGYVKSDEPPTDFNMSMWHCGTTCCIGGWAEALFVPNKKHRLDPDITTAWALGLDEDTAEALFYPAVLKTHLPYERITPAMAARVIRILVTTGVVRWDLVVDEVEDAA